MMAPTLYFWRVPEKTVRQFLESRDRGHVEVMRGFPADLGATPRSKAGVLWRLEPEQQLLVVQSAELVPTYPAWQQAGTFPVGAPPAGDYVSYRLALACQKTPPAPVPEHLREAVKRSRAAAQEDRRAVLEASGMEPNPEPPRGSYRSKKVVVPEGDRPGWFRGRMARIGLTVVGDPDISNLRRARLGRKRGTIPYVDVSFTAKVADEDALTAAVRKGVGAGKSYGLGLLMPTAAVPSASQ